MGEPKVTIKIDEALTDAKLQYTSIDDLQHLRLVPLAPGSYSLRRLADVRGTGNDTISDIVTIATLFNSASTILCTHNQTYNNLSTCLIRMINEHNCRVEESRNQWMVRSLLGVPYVCQAVRWFLPHAPVITNFNRMASNRSFEEFLRQYQNISQRQLQELQNQIMAFRRSTPHTQEEGDRLLLCTNMLIELEKTVAELELSSEVSQYHSVIRRCDNLGQLKTKVGNLRQTIAQISAAARSFRLAVDLTPLSTQVDQIQSVGVRNFSPAFSKAASLEPVDDVLAYYGFRSYTSIANSQPIIEKALKALAVEPNHGLDPAEIQVIERAIAKIQDAYNAWLEHFFRRKAENAEVCDNTEIEALKRLVAEQKRKVGVDQPIVKRLDTLLKLTLETHKYRAFFDYFSGTTADLFLNARTTSSLYAQLQQLLADNAESNRLHNELFPLAHSRPWHTQAQKARELHLSALKRIAPVYANALYFRERFATVEAIARGCTCADIEKNYLAYLHWSHDGGVLSAEDIVFIRSVRSDFEKALAVRLETEAKALCNMVRKDPALEQQLRSFIETVLAGPPANYPPNLEQLKKLSKLMTGYHQLLPIFAKDNPYAGERDLKVLREKYQAHKARIQELHQLHLELFGAFTDGLSDLKEFGIKRENYQWKEIENKCDAAYLDIIHKISPALAMAVKIHNCPADESLLSHLGFTTSDIPQILDGVARIFTQLAPGPQDAHLDPSNTELIKTAHERLWDAYGAWVEPQITRHLPGGHFDCLNELYLGYGKALRRRGTPLSEQTTNLLNLCQFVVVNPLLFKDPRHAQLHHLFPETDNTSEMTARYEAVNGQFDKLQKYLTKLGIAKVPATVNAKKQAIKTHYEMAINRVHSDLLIIRQLAAAPRSFFAAVTVKTTFREIMQVRESALQLVAPSRVIAQRISPADRDLIAHVKNQIEEDFKTCLEKTIPARADSLPSLTFRTLFAVQSREECHKVRELIQPFLVNPHSRLAQTVLPLLETLVVEEFRENVRLYTPQDSDSVAQLRQKRSECERMKASTANGEIQKECERLIQRCDLKIELKIVVESSPQPSDTIEQLVQKRKNLQEFIAKTQNEDLQAECRKLIEVCVAVIAKKIPLYKDVRDFCTQPKEKWKLNTVQVAEYQFLFTHCFKYRREAIPQVLVDECKQALAVLQEIKAEEISFKPEQIFDRLLLCIYGIGEVKFNEKTQVRRRELFISAFINFTAWGNDLTLLFKQDSAVKTVYPFLVEVFTTLEKAGSRPEDLIPECRDFYSRYYSAGLSGLKTKLLEMNPVAQPVLAYLRWYEDILASRAAVKPSLGYNIFGVLPYDFSDLFNLTKALQLKAAYQAKIEQIDKLKDESMTKMGACCPLLEQIRTIVVLGYTEWHAQRIMLIRANLIEFAHRANYFNKDGWELMRNALMCVNSISPSYTKEKRDRDIKKQWVEYCALFHTDKIVNFPEYYQKILGEAYSIASGLYQIKVEGSIDEFGPAYGNRVKGT